jgi:hypothetical protein
VAAPARSALMASSVVRGELYPALSCQGDLTAVAAAIGAVAAAASGPGAMCVGT